MSYSPINTYLTSFDSLVFDSPSETIQTEKEIDEELDLWSKAQFTFDVKPGVGIYDEEKSKTNSPVSPAASQFDMQGLDSATYESLVNYLDYELPSRPEVKLEKPKQRKIQPRIQPRPLAPAPAPIVPATTRQVLMPKPPAVTPTQLLSSLIQNNNNTSNDIAAAVAAAIENKTGTKRPLEEETDESVTPDEDKRRRNTAASARFRVKKKMREQAMEQSVREMTQKSEKLQDRVNQLEIEIKFLRSLLLDKANNKN